MQPLATNSRRISVLSLVDDVTALGGVEAFQYDLAAQLPKLGVDFAALNLKPKSKSARELPEWALDYPSSRWSRGPLFGIRGRRFLRRFGQCFFLGHQPSSLSFLASILPGPRLPMLSVVHNNSTRDQYWQNQIRWKDRILGYIAVSAAIRERLIEQCGIESRRVWTIPCGINTANARWVRRVPPPKRSRRISLLYVGRLSNEIKRVLDLVSVVRALNQSSLPPDWELSLHVAGDGPDEATLRQGLYEVAGRVEIVWHGRIPREQLFGIYGQAHFVLLLSSSEGMPIALREAMSRGAVPLVTDIPAHREIITAGMNGFLFPPGDAAECVRLCCSIAESERYQQFSRNAALSIHDHSVEATAEQYATLLEQFSSSFAGDAKAHPQKALASKARSA